MAKKPMPKRLISLTTRQLKWLQYESKRIGVSVSALVRISVDTYQTKMGADVNIKKKGKSIREKV